MDTEQLFKHIAKGTYYNINSDKDLQNDDRFRMKERNKKYSDILDIYTKNINRVLWVKLIFRIVFLIVSIGALVGTFILFCVILSWIAHERTIMRSAEAVISIISSMVSMVTAFIVLPKIMTKYLFNIKEEKNIYSLVKQIQNYDHIIRDSLK